jgi:hypothetical protein
MTPTLVKKSRRPLDLRSALPLACVALWTVTTLAHAQNDEKAACAQAAELGQESRREGRLLDALARFQRCGRQSCPGVITSDCINFAAEVNAILPSVVFRARDPEGRDVTEVTVLIDGIVVAKRIDGRAVSLDPGEHRVRFEAAGRPPIERTIVVAEGEKSRLVTGVVPSLKRTTPSPAWLFAGLGAASLGGFAYFGLSARSERNELKNGCGTTRTCTDEEVDGVREKALVADVLLGVGLASLTTAGLWWALSGHAPANPDDAQSVSFELQPKGGLLGWKRSF